ncbi:Enoyl-CoA hydratase [Natronoarchaeum philippinense]|uniref:Enoyl-CoA hydratase n=1 Tax=Natronoarchaeum philippinense TaxID=558529 RepID=A0A285N755_NATPI|nr:enoyl-CoA hydratase-related protein [Natronoarchaeum philippinense]SNZ05312.1 Enoyl-CoA hydratase [Natronoarchaeum philippinense]
MSDESVLLDIDDGVATITLNRPDERNALSRPVAEGIRDALDDADAADARCVVLEGAGEAFSAGGDIEAMVEGIQGDLSVEERVRVVERSFNRTIERLAEFPLPTVALLDGAAIGAGASLAIACDLQLASEHCSIGFSFRAVGLSVDSGTSYFLPRIVGENVAKELVFTGEVVDADRAAELGLVNHVYPADEFDDRAADLVDRIASGPTVALRHAKRLLGDGVEKSLSEALADEALAQGVAFDTDDHVEGVESFFEGRDAEFEGR